MPEAPPKSGPPRESRGESDRLIVLGQELEDAGDLARAETRFQEAIAAAPSYPRAYINLGNALQKLGRLHDSTASHRAALKLNPDYAEAHSNLGAVLIQLGDTSQAKQHLEHALELKPDMAETAIILASAFELEGNLPGARRQLERALLIEPQHAGAMANLGGVLLGMGDVGDAEKLLRNALRVDPDSIPALTGLALIDVQRGRAVLTDTAYRHALRLDPSDPIVWSSFLFSLNLRDDLDAEAVAREHFAFGKIFDRNTPAKTPKKSTARRIRIGYVSADLMKHPVGLFLRPILASHHRAEFETFCYSNGRVEDELTIELRGICDQWRSIAVRDDPWVEDLIRADGIDVLVDLSGHTVNNRLGVFARRPAPAQATWLGYLNTTGLQAMDFRICDSYTDPEGETDDLSSESIARLPNSQWCYAPYYDIPLGNPATDGNRPITFGSFNQFAKVSDGCLDLWATILAAVPDSRLRVYGVPKGVATDDFHARLERRGIQWTRVALHGRIGVLDYFAAMQDADIALDSMPYNGATTTLDTLWMGTPVVGLRGDRAISRGTYSILSASGLTEFIAENPADYVEKNIRLAQDTAGRLALRRSLRSRLQASPLMDAKRFTRDLEVLYRRMLEAR